MASFQSAKTHCPQGHPYSGLNLIVTKDGKRRCYDCTRATRRRFEERHPYLSKRRADFDTHCKNGHLWTVESTYLPPGGRGRQCRLCQREATERYRAKARAQETP